jgi:hypothetical protein
MFKKIHIIKLHFEYKKIFVIICAKSFWLKSVIFFRVISYFDIENSKCQTFMRKIFNKLKLNKIEEKSCIIFRDNVKKCKQKGFCFEKHSKK